MPSHFKNGVELKKLVDEITLGEVTQARKETIDTLMRFMRPSEIITDLMDVINKNPEKLETCVDLFNNLLSPAFYEKFTVYPLKPEYILSNIPLWNSSPSRTHSDGDWVGTQVKVNSNNNDTKSEEEIVMQPCELENNKIPNVLGSFLNNIASKDTLPLALDLCMLFLLSVNNKYNGSLETVLCRKKVEIDFNIITEYYCSWLNSLLKFTSNGIKNCEVLPSIIRLCHTYCLLLSSDSIKDEKGSRHKKIIDKSTSELDGIIKALLITTKWTIIAFENTDDCEINWSAAKIFHTIAEVDNYAEIFLNNLDQDTIAELIMCIFKKLRMLETDEEWQNNYDPLAHKSVTYSHLSNFLQTIYTVSKIPFFKEIIGASVKVYQINIPIEGLITAYPEQLINN